MQEVILGTGQFLTSFGKLLKNSQNLFEAIKKRDLSAASMLMNERVKIIEEIKALFEAKVFQENSDIKDELVSIIMEIDSLVDEVKKLMTEQLTALTNELNGVTKLKKIAVYKAQGGHYGY